LSVLRAFSKALGTFSDPITSIQFCNFSRFFNHDYSNIPTFPLSVKYILLDNVSFHRSNCIKEFVESKGFKFLFIPPYSPQYNPIEEVFSDMKRVFRRSLMASNRKFDLAISDSINYIKENQLGIVQHYVSTYKKCNE
jgi:hypothetical protein